MKLSKIVCGVIAALNIAVFCAAVSPITTVSAYGTTDGRCGDRVNWSIDGSGLLTISGEGRTYTWYSESSSPWAHLKDIITSVKVEEGVTYIGSYAFTGCYSLKTVMLPSTLDMIGQALFLDCPAIEGFLVDSANPKFSQDANGALYNKSQSILLRYPAANKSESFTIPSTVKTVMGSAFRDSKNLKSIYIPDSVTSIGDRAFINCTKLEAITVPSKVTKIENETFKGCENLKTVDLPAGITSIGDAAFYLCPSIERYTVAAGGKHYSSDSAGVLFNGTQTELIRYPAASNGESYTLPETVVEITGSAFRSAENLKNVILSEGLSLIGDRAFIDCTGLTDIVIPKSVKKIDYEAFSGCKRLRDVKICSTVVEFGDNVFSGTSSELVISAYDKSTSEDYTFGTPFKFKELKGSADLLVNRCGTALTWELDDGGTLTISGLGNMYVWTSAEMTPWSHIANKIEHVVISEGVTDIGSFAFCGLSRLKSVTIPSGVSKIGSSAFYLCPMIERYTVSKANKYFSNDELGALYNYDKTILIRYPAANSAVSYTLPGTVKEIYGSSFRDAVNLKEVIIPEGVTSLGDRVFIDCTALESVVIPSTVAEVRDMAFSGCTSLKSVTFHSKETSVGKSAFIGASPELEIHFYASAPETEAPEIKDEPSEGLSFVDVSTDDSFYEAVKFAVENGLFNGTSKLTFSPDAPMTRAMFVTVLGRYAEADTALYKTPTFTDVAAEMWYTGYVEWAAANGIVNGVADGVFGVDGDVTVAQACVILARTHAFKPSASASGNTSDEFSDAAAVPDWAKEGVEWAITTGVYNPSREILPNTPASRAVVAEMFANCVKYFG